MWYFWNSPCAATTIDQHLHAISPESPFHITKDDRAPGSKLDMYERGTHWAKRFQDTDKRVVKERRVARRDRTDANEAHCKKTYNDQKFREDEKHARRIANFRIQNQYWEGTIRRKEPNSNPEFSKTIGFDMGNQMHCPKVRKTPRHSMVKQANDVYAKMNVVNGHEARWNNEPSVGERPLDLSPKRLPSPLRGTSMNPDGMVEHNDFLSTLSPKRTMVASGYLSGGDRFGSAPLHS